MIGLFISEKIRRDFPYRYKLKILARPGTLQEEDDSNRQINDKGNTSTACAFRKFSESVMLGQ
jgi:hypothetical protein